MKYSLGNTSFLEEISRHSHSIVFLYFFESLRKAFLSLLAILWNSAFKWGYLSFFFFDIMEYYSAIKKNEIMPFATTWIDLEIIIFPEVRWRKTNIV